MKSMNNLIKSINKLSFFVDTIYYKKLFIFSILILFSMFLELFSIGLIFPIVNLILDGSFLDGYPNIKIFFKSISPVQFLNKSEIFNIISGALILFFISVLIKNIFLLLINIFRANLIYRISHSVRKKIVFQLSETSLNEILKEKTSNIIHVVSQSLGIISMLENALIILAELVVLVGILFFLIFFDSSNITIILIVIFASLLLIRILKKKILYYGEQRYLHEGSQLNYLTNIIQGIKEIKLSNSFDFFLKYFNFHSKKGLYASKKFNIYSQFPRIFFEVIIALSIVIYLTQKLIHSDNYSEVFASAAVFLAAGIRLIPSLGKIINSYNSYKYSLPLLDKVYEFYLKLNKSKQTKPYIINFKKNIILKNIDLKFSEKKIFDNLNLEILHGEKIGIIGESGIGKSTLINLISGLLKPDKGNILVDNKNINDNYFIEDLGLVSQNPFFANTTVKKNLCFGLTEDKINNKKIYEVLQTAELLDVVKKLENELDTIVGERGSKFSSGQLQRLSIARSLYNEPQSLILDEATSALDKDTELKVLNNIFKNYENKTIILISHNFENLKRCSKIYKIINHKLELIKK